MTKCVKNYCMNGPRLHLSMCHTLSNAPHVCNRDTSKRRRGSIKNTGSQRGTGADGVSTLPCHVLRWASLIAVTHKSKLFVHCLFQCLTQYLALPPMGLLVERAW